MYYHISSFGNEPAQKFIIADEGELHQRSRLFFVRRLREIDHRRKIYMLWFVMKEDASNKYRLRTKKHPEGRRINETVALIRLSSEYANWQGMISRTAFGSALVQISPRLLCSRSDPIPELWTLMTKFTAGRHKRHLCPSGDQKRIIESWIMCSSLQQLKLIISFVHSHPSLSIADV